LLKTSLAGGCSQSGKKHMCMLWIASMLLKMYGNGAQH